MNAEDLGIVAPQNRNPQYRGRVRSGCLTCRAKKVKCDENRPNCARCSRLKRQCVYQAKITRRTHHTLRARDTLLPGPQGSKSIGTIQIEPTSQDNERQERHGPPASCLHSIVHDDTVFPSLPNFDRVLQETSLHTTRLSQLNSNEIYLVTTLDLLAAKHISFSFFLEEVEVPLVTAFDAISWGRWKQYTVGIAAQQKSVAATISALQLLFKSLKHSVSSVTAISAYELAKCMFMDDLRDESQDFNIIYLNAFLLTLFSIILYEGVDCIFMQSDGSFMDRLRSWAMSKSMSPISSRLTAWLEILHAAARRGGNQGILSDCATSLLCTQDNEVLGLSFVTPNHHVPITALELARALVFRFHLDLQGLSLKSTRLSHYHRSRNSASDQEEVITLMTSLRNDFHSLWLARPAVMRCDDAEIHTQFSKPEARQLINLMGISKAAYHAEHVEIARNLNDPPSGTPEARDGMYHIRELVDRERSAAPEDQLNPGYLRPLFMCAIESVEPNDIQWAVERMREIKNQICRSDFFASYAESLAASQKSLGRRVTTRWFCYQQYGVRPPVL